MAISLTVLNNGKTTDATGEYKHPEAFCLMLYCCEENREHKEIIWNCRDGVTPFKVSCRAPGCRAMMQHAVNGMLRATAYIPHVGQRMFCDITEERAAERAKNFVDHYWGLKVDGLALQERYSSKQEAMLVRIKDWLKPGAPDCREVTQEIRELYIEQRKVEQGTEDPVVLSGDFVFVRSNHG